MPTDTVTAILRLRVRGYDPGSCFSFFTGCAPGWCSVYQASDQGHQAFVSSAPNSSSLCLKFFHHGLSLHGYAWPCFPDCSLLGFIVEFQGRCLADKTSVLRRHVWDLRARTPESPELVHRQDRHCQCPGGIAVTAQCAGDPVAM